MVFALAVAWVALQAGAQKSGDQALLVEVTHAPGLPEMSRLKGPPGDVVAVGTELGRLGFNVETIHTKDATLDAILDKIDKVGKTVAPGGKFVFYFAGHGLDSATPTLMTYNATAKTNLLTVEKLFSRVRAISQAGSRSIIIDACHSEALVAKSAEDGPVSRSYLPDDEQRLIAKNAVPLERIRQSPQKTFSGQREVVYFAAARANESAYEYSIGPGNQYRGFFSFALANRLRGMASSPTTWMNLEDAVRGDVQELMRRYRRDATQQPNASPFARNTLVFDPPPSATPVLRPVDLFVEPKEDASVLTLESSRPTSDLGVNEPAQYFADVKKPGWLFAVTQDKQGASLLWPRPRGEGGDAALSVEDARIEQGRKVQLSPADRKGTTFDTYGNNRVIAFYFSEPVLAKGFFDLVANLNPLAREETLKKLADPASPYVSAAMEVNITNRLAGGLVVTDPRALYEAWPVYRIRPVTNWAARIQAATPEDAGRLIIAGTNEAIWERAGRKGLAVFPQYFDAQKLPPELKERLTRQADLSEGEVAALSSAILAHLVPKAFSSGSAPP